MFRKCQRFQDHPLRVRTFGCCEYMPSGRVGDGWKEHVVDWGERKKREGLHSTTDQGGTKGRCQSV